MHYLYIAVFRALVSHRRRCEVEVAGHIGRHHDDVGDIGTGGYARPLHLGLTADHREHLLGEAVIFKAHLQGRTERERGGIRKGI